MAFTVAADLPYFNAIGGQAGRSPAVPRANNLGGPAIWSFKATDAHATIDGAGYFNPILGLLSIGDLIFVAVVTNRGAATEALSTAGLHVVVNKSATAVDVTNVETITVTDSD